MEFGLLGAVFILFAWLYEAYKTYKKGEKLDIKFIGAYIAGLSLLTVHAYQINDFTFLALNVAILAMTVIELALNLWKR